MSNTAVTRPRVEGRAPPWWKRLELVGRRVLMFLLGAVVGKRPRPLVLPHAPRFLLVRLDERVGNLVMLTPMLRTLRVRFPEATIDVLGHARGEALLGTHPDLDGFVRFRKRALFASDGPLRTSFGLRKRGYAVAIDASNPTDPSLTQALLVALSGAHFTIGSTARGFGPFFSHRVHVDAEHEIDLRLQLLDPLPGDERVRAPSLPAVKGIPKALAHSDASPYAVLNLGARLPEKRLSVDDYVQVAEAMEPFRRIVLTWGPKERALAEAVSARVPGAQVAPATDLSQLSAVFSRSRAVVSCDTGPMHLAVALGVPTLGIFVATDPLRFGYGEPPHGWVDAREARSGLRARVERWVERLPGA